MALRTWLSMPRPAEESSSRFASRILIGGGCLVLALVGIGGLLIWLKTKEGKDGVLYEAVDEEGKEPLKVEAA